MTSPRARAVKIMKWLERNTEMCCSHPSEARDAEDRITEEIADALEELREGFLRPPTGRNAVHVR